MRKQAGILMFLAGCLVATALVVSPVPAQAAEKAVLGVGDCAKCHEKEPALIEAKGAAHKTQINCQSCHQGHRPAVAANIPKCSMCHAGGKHYELEGCNSCHNPHQPLEISLKGDLKAPCLTCHEGVGQEMTATPSAHAKVACNFCHADKHGMIPQCTDCHAPHSADMKPAECKTCHQAHKPTQLAYGPQIPSAQCGSCHAVAYKQLAASKTKHQEVACVTCHQNKHKTVPKCSDCHGLPHAETMHAKFPKCGDCHNTAHDLNNFQAKKEADAKKAAPKKGEAAPKKKK